MPRSVPDASKADETITVRLPKGTADKVRAATGQPFSTVVRWMVTQLLAKYAAEANAKEATREEVQRTVGDALGPDDRGLA